MKARRPYLLRAIHEWISDSLCTPHLVVDANAGDVEVPRPYVKDGKIVLNVSWSATANLRLGNEDVTFSGRFGGVSMSVRVPIHAVLAIYARETGQGMIFAEDDVEGGAVAAAGKATSPETPGDDDPGPKPTSPADSRRARFKVVK
jgi:stringent starvation protein B